MEEYLIGKGFLDEILGDAPAVSVWGFGHLRKDSLFMVCCRDMRNFSGVSYMMG
jgi:hypothetical protein